MMSGARSYLVIFDPHTGNRKRKQEMGEVVNFQSPTPMTYVLQQGSAS